MPKALSLLDWSESRARSSDPIASKKASAEVRPKVSGLKLQFLEKLRELGQATANEVAAAITNDFGRRNTLRRRASDLVEDGLIRIVGERVCNVTGKPVSLYEVVN